MEWILVAFVAIVLISIVQGVRRSDSSPEARQKDPTLMESIAAGANQLEKTMSVLEKSSLRYSAKAHFKLEYCSWYRSFEHAVNHSMKRAAKDALLERHLDANPGLRDRYERISEEMRTKFQVKGPSELTSDLRDMLSWAQKAPPAPPPFMGSDMDALYQEAYAEEKKRHDGFVETTRTALRCDRYLEASFVVYMSKWGLDNIVAQYFPASAPTRTIGAP